ncbi:MAG TPA: HIT family protein [Candidatus Acidoferrales bacterium]|nr:HIT family protein [Candidatus Acidoferrales bacterium]
MKHSKRAARGDVQMQASVGEECAFCEIAKGHIDCVRVFEDENTFVFLDHRPLFPGHCLLITRRHIRTLADLPPSLIEPVFLNVRMLAMAVQNAMQAEGSFIAINNIVSQSVSHFHVHVIPRRKGDGLRGFMWPRHKYESAGQAQAVGDAIRKEIARLRGATT